MIGYQIDALPTVDAKQPDLCTDGGLHCVVVLRADDDPPELESQLQPIRCVICLRGWKSEGSEKGICDTTPGVR